MFTTPATIRRRPLPLVIPPGVDFNFATWLVGQGVTEGRVEAVLPVGSIIGGTIQDGYAFTVGDISAYSSVILNIDGEIQGMGGAASGGAGSNGLISTGGALTLNIAGAIYGGGGGGGDGGLGAFGSALIGRVEKYANVSTLADAYVAIPKKADGSNYCVTDGFIGYAYCSAAGYPGATNDNAHWLGFSCGYPAFVSSNVSNVPYRVLEIGSFRENALPLAVGGNSTNGPRDLYSMFESTYVSGVSTVGTGGKGQGYEGAAEPGVAGSATNRAGIGGTGGAGSAWNTVGITGNEGDPGISFSRHGSAFEDSQSWYDRATMNVATINFDPGAAGGAAGIDINVTMATIVNKLNED